jgi:hydroxypyruvate isomerase
MAGRNSSFKLSVRVEALFPGLALPETMRRVAAAGYQAFEFGDWRAADPAAIVKLKQQLRLECACIVGNKSVNPKGMGLCDPAERSGFLGEVAASLEAAKRFETPMLVILSGFKVPGLPRAPQHASIVEGLKRAAEMAAREKITIIVEPINTRAKIEPLNPKGDNHANYYLDHFDEAKEIMHEVGSPYVKILYDLYHAQIMDGNLIQTIRENLADIAHIHVGDVPGRHEPGTGEIQYGNVFAAIHDSGFKGYVAMEYVPSKDAMVTLREARKLVLTSISSSRPK